MVTYYVRISYYYHYPIAALFTIVLENRDSIYMFCGVCTYFIVTNSKILQASSSFYIKYFTISISSKSVPIKLRQRVGTSSLSAGTSHHVLKTLHESFS